MDYLKKIIVINPKRGINTPKEYSKYPPKLGIFTLFSSATDFTMKLGAFPMYVFAPMNTAPTEIAFNNCSHSGFARN